MKAFGIVAPDGLRQSLREKFAEFPLDGTSPDELADLAFHAINEALGAIDRTALRASSQLAQLAVYSVAIAEAARGFAVINEQTIAGVRQGLATSQQSGATL